jgi:2-dehydro-3-deoxyphosphooctonate aldolase (KDO 8-P synthase)
MFDNLYEELQNCPLFFLIAGPCVIENESILLKTAEVLSNITSQLGIPFVFKSSFTKANRTSSQSYKGPGRDSGLKLLQKVKSTFNVPILTDVHETQDVAAVSEVCDIIQIPAFLCRQTSLLQEAAQSGKIINIKKGQFLAPEDMSFAADKVTNRNNRKVMLTERGTTFGYHNLIVDFRSFAILNGLGFPVVYDVTHSLQRPSESVNSSGSPEFVKMMAQSAIASCAINGLFIETHPEPSKALSDAASMLPLGQVAELLEACLRIRSVLLK